MAEYQGKYKSVYNPGIEFETDYIAREAARDLMYHNQGPLTEYDLNDLPPADVQPVVRSEWVLNDNRTWSCKRCHSWIPDEQRYYANYCLFCGADMTGGDADG